VDAALRGKEREVSVSAASELPGGRLVVASTGSLDDDTADVRSFAEAAQAGVARAKKAGARRPLLVVCPVDGDPRFAHAIEVAALGALSAAWTPLECRPSESEALLGIGLLPAGEAAIGVDGAAVGALERARFACRDMTGTEPETMAPEGMADYAERALAGLGLKVSVERSRDAIHRGFPLVEAVGRASYRVERHHPRIIRIEYQGAGTAERSFFFAGKGVSYDTGGADLKTGGHMAGMSRDMGGAGAVLGLMRWLGESQPAGVRVVGLIGAVRNSVGADAYVSDEIITSRAGVRVRIGNTDAEGRLVLADLLAALREEAATAARPALFSIATLTGHVERAYGPYTAILENGAARAAGLGDRIALAGERFGDPLERSRVRREDYAFIQGRTGAEDVLSCNTQPSSMTARGHQFPFAFLDLVSGLARRGLPFAHLDIAGSATEGGDFQFGRPSAAPMLALIKGLFGG
jgi:leucyl aminopeptidase